MSQVRQDLFAGAIESDDGADTNRLNNEDCGIPGKQGDVDSYSSDKDELNEAGDIGSGLHIYASYQVWH